MHIVRQDGLAGSGAAPGGGPAVRSRQRLIAGARGEEVIHLGGVAILQHVLFDDIVAPGSSEIAVHVEADQQAIDHAPRLRLIPQQRELHRQVVQVGGDELIHPQRVCREGRAIFRG